MAGCWRATSPSTTAWSTAVGLGGGGGRGIAAPGFVDLQVNGFAGVDLRAADAEAYSRAGQALLATGVTAFQPTFITAPEAEPRRGAGRDADQGLWPAGDRRAPLRPVPSPQRLGAHDAEGLVARPTSPCLWLLEAGPVSQMTLAPELHGAFELIGELVGRGVTVSCGHSYVTAAEAHLAFDRGARTVTHLFNAMRPSVPRDPGIAMAALARADVTVQVIVDGHHLAGETVLVAWQAAPGRFALVSDAVAAAAWATGATCWAEPRSRPRAGWCAGPTGRSRAVR